MIISANGILFNEYADVLLIQRDDTRTFAPPGGACEIDELPQQAAAREVQEETGILVQPIRLVGLYHLPTCPNNYLFLCFRCIQSGGKLAASNETLRSGFFKTNMLPNPMLAFHREQIHRAFRHSGGPPYWGNVGVSPLFQAGNLVLNRLVYPLLGFRRARQNKPEYVPPPSWQVNAAIILRNDQDEVLWLRSNDQYYWTLPATEESYSVSPWTAANRLLKDILPGESRLNDLSGIYIKQGKPEMTFVFTASFDGLYPLSHHHTALYAPGQELEDISAIHQSMILDSQNSGGQVTYRSIPDL